MNQLSRIVGCADQRQCQTRTVYVRPVIRDKLTPIEAEVRYSLRQPSAAAAAEIRRRNRRQLPPVLGTDAPSVSDLLRIRNNCGQDSVCIPDMRVSARA